MHARGTSYALLIAALLFAAPASAQWVVHVRDQTGQWKRAPDTRLPTEDLAYNQARRMCIHAVQAIASRTQQYVPPAVKIVAPGNDPGQARVIPCEELVAPSTLHPSPSAVGTHSSTAPSPASVATPVMQPSRLPSLDDLKRNPIDAIRRWAGSPTTGTAPADRPATITQTPASSTFDVVGVRLGMAPAAADAAVRDHMPVGWVYVRDRSKKTTRARIYESMKGYIANDLSEVILVYFEPSLADGTLVGVRRFSMIGKKVDPAMIEAALVQKYGRPSVAKNNNWTWGQPSGCMATEVGSLKLNDVKFVEGTARSDQQFKQVIATALDLAKYGAPVKREYWDACRPVLYVLKSANNGVMTTLVDQKFTMSHLAAERHDDAAIAF